MFYTVCSVYDDAAKAFLPPFFVQSRGIAVRSFTDAVNSRDHQFSMHPADYTLFVLGQYDDADASFNLYATPESLGKGIQYKEEPEAPLFSNLEGE